MTLWVFNVVKEGEKIKSITIRLSDILHEVVKIKLLENNQSFQQHVIVLIQKELDLKVEDDDLSDYMPKKYNSS